MSDETHSASMPSSITGRLARALFAAAMRLLGRDAEVWEGDNLIISQARGYHLHAFRYVGPHGKVRWQTVSMSDRSPIHAYWIAGDTFYLTRGKLSKKRYRGNFMGSLATDVDPEERAALQEAIQATANDAEGPAVHLQ